MTKIISKIEAIEKRKQGESITTIARDLHVSKSTASRWVRHVQLSEQQIAHLQENSNNLSDEKRTARDLSFSRKCRENRSKWQEDGKKRAASKDPGFVGGCMLYWGEGGKSERARVAIVNSDPDVLVYFVGFLKKYYQVTPDRIRAVINCHLDYGLTYETVRDFWSNTLGISASQFWKPQIHQGSLRTKGKHRRLKYGTCSITVLDVKIAQSIFGAIQQIANISKPEWLG